MSHAHDPALVEQVAEVLIDHRPLGPPFVNQCWCGHVVPLGHRFSHHIATAVLDAIWPLTCPECDGSGEVCTYDGGHEATRSYARCGCCDGQGKATADRIAEWADLVAEHADDRGVEP